MPHDTPLIATIVAGLGLAFIFGALANRFRIPPLVGYLVAGVLVGPNTPGFVADQHLALELAEIGVILLMFGVGLHFSLKDLLSVRAIALPGAIVQMGFATALGMGLAWMLGWTPGAGLVFGLALSVASTVVLLRAMQERRMIETERGRIAVGWLIVEDLAMVLALVLLPALAGLLGGTEQPVAASGDLFGLQATYGIWGVLGLTLGKVVAFVAVMIMSESELSHRAAEESLPLRDAFSVLFFVSVGMLFDPNSLFEETWPILATLFIIVIGKSVAAFLIVAVFRYPLATALIISASLAQIGEFSFILAELGVGLGLLPEQGRDLILAGAILSILINPLLFAAADYLNTRTEKRPAETAPAVTAAASGPATEPGSLAAGLVAEARPAEADVPVATRLSDHTILVGYGRVGSLVGKALREAGLPFLVIEDGDKTLQRLHADGVETVSGNAASAGVFALANAAGAKRLVLAIPNAFEAGQIILRARAANPGIAVIARAHSDDEVDHLKKLGADTVIMGEREIARGIVEKVVSEPDTGGSIAA